MYLFYLFIFLIFWLHLVLVAAHGIFIEACRIFLLWHMVSLLQCAGFSLVVAYGFSLPSCSKWAPGLMGSVVCSTQVLIEPRKLNSCGTWAYLPRSMWDLSSPTRDWTHVAYVGRPILYHWITREVQNSPLSM